MIDALFWYTGLIVWVLIVLGIASMLAVGAHGRSGKSPIGTQIGFFRLAPGHDRCLAYRSLVDRLWSERTFREWKDLSKNGQVPSEANKTASG
jgi:hypothetical protein